MWQLIDSMKADLCSAFCPHDIYVSYALKDNWCEFRRSSVPPLYISGCQLEQNLKDQTMESSDQPGLR